MIDKDEVIEQAKKELQEEQFREAVDKMKAKLSRKRKIFPWRIVVINLNKGE